MNEVSANATTTFRRSYVPKKKVKEVELDSQKNREKLKAEISKIRGHVENEIRQEDKAMWQFYLERRQVAKESCYYDKSVEQSERKTSFNKIDSHFKKIVRDCKTAKELNSMMFNEAHMLRK